MKHRTLLFCASLVCAIALSAQEIVNITPLPKQMTMGKGQFELKKGLSISVSNLPDSLRKEAQRFLEALNQATALEATLSQRGGQIKLLEDKSISLEGYKLDITPSAITIKAKSARGFFYAFQTIKKMLPANVMAQIKDPTQTSLRLPALRIIDEPRFSYRGFMLDVSRHFFEVEEIKRLLDIMAVYKMNVFHWHLTDDQGWRAEIKKYPRLTQVGSISQNCRFNDMEKGVYWTNQPYGPYFYTQEQMREVVRYAQERHIDVLPEIDMPGHFVAALASYPQFSCNERDQHNVLTYQGGVWDDVLNVGDAKAVEFAKDILAELCDIFPYPYIHIGGDECPTTAWEKNAQCQALKEEQGLDSYRKLQSRFIKEISDFVKTKGKRLFVWNESITAQGADLEQIKESDCVVMSWNPCQKGALMAAQLGLSTIITEYHSSTGGYYINRRQSTDASEPAAAGQGDDTVEGCYNYIPVPKDVPQDLIQHYKGVQATFWTEWVSDREYLEYLALPRLMAVAEAGWSPQEKKDFNSFRQRMALDRAFLDLKGYNYGRHIFK